MSQGKMRVLVTGGSGFIGTALLTDLLRLGHDVRNIDLRAPTLEQHRSMWLAGDVLESRKVRDVIQEFNPDRLIHLAAETEIGEPTGSLEEAYPVNCKSAASLAAAIAGTSVKRCVMVSTQYVCGPVGRMPRDPLDTFPHTRYGESKVVLEQDTRRLISSEWVIVRPTYVWGPNNVKNFRDLIRTVAAGRYLHPGGAAVTRAYCYVGTASWMLVRALAPDVPTGTTFYATDAPEDSAEYIRRLSLAMGRRGVIRVPRPILQTLARVGDTFKAFPLNSFRYFNMTTDYPVPTEWVPQQMGTCPTELFSAAAATAQWFKALHKQ